MAVTVQRQLASAVTEMSQDAWVGAALEHGTTLILFALRQHAFPQALGPQATRGWRPAADHGKVPALLTFHHPLQYRFL